MKGKREATRLRPGQTGRAAALAREQLARAAAALERGETRRAASAAGRAGAYLALAGRAPQGEAPAPDPDWGDLAREVERLKTRAEERRAVVEALLAAERERRRLSGVFAAAPSAGGLRLDCEG